MSARREPSIVAAVVPLDALVSEADLDAAAGVVRVLRVIATVQRRGDWWFWRLEFSCGHWMTTTPAVPSLHGRRPPFDVGDAVVCRRCGAA